ncbi:zinc finger protein 341-like [Biomphalaria glabrata]|uniref:Zinc finger protein 341-like n=2 Tax=Biomphalaria glabrata TaxID=6526 RepID=A0A9W3AY97_BIOGL|nr:zinc finger protein 341-like [Biomphalaria glabrata]
MERLSTQSIGQDANGCIALCYQLNQPLSVQSLDTQTAVAVQSLLDSQTVSENPEEDEDIFQCGKCKKQFSLITAFVKHKQSQCSLQQSIHLPQQAQEQQIAMGASSGVFSPAMNMNQSYSQMTGTVVPTITTNAPILQAHPCLTRSLNQPPSAATLTLSGVSSSSLSQLSQNMVFTDDLMSLANIDPNTLNGQTIQMVTGPMQSANSSNSVTIFSPITSLAPTPNNYTSPSPPGIATGQLLVQSAQHITLTAISDKSMQLQQHQQQPAMQHMPQAVQPPTLPVIQQSPITASQSSQLNQPTQQAYKSSPTKAGRKSAQNSFISVLNADNNLLSTRKGKSSRNAKNNSDAPEDETNTKPKLVCTYCNKQFTKNFDLQQHIRAHTGEKPFQCIVCGRAFAQKSNVKKHMTTHKVWPCGTSNTLPKQPEPVLDDKDVSSSCSSSSSVITTVAPTQAQQLSDVITAASESKLMSPVHQFNAVKKMEKQVEEKFSKVKVVVDNSYICQYCPSKFKTYYQLKTHLVNHKSEQVYKCVMKNCGHSFHDLDTYLEHVKSHENEMTYRCHQCHKYFKNLYDLGVHQYTHIYMNQAVKSGLRHFQCTKCGNKYTTPEALEHHMSTTSHDYKCPHCNKQFTCERFLRRHLPIHGSEGQFECHQCSKKFKTEHYLKSHMLIHTGETPYSCDICQAAFNRKDKLKRHMTIHDLIKKYRCPFRSIAGCLKEFNRPDKLKAHIVTHSGIKPYKCSICDKAFSRKPHLAEHERGHKMDYRFKCEKCGKGYFRPKLFNEHKCQPSKNDQQFRPRNRRKVGRPRKRMITIAPDSLSKSRGKQYSSRTRMKVKAQRMLAVEELAGQLEQQGKEYAKQEMNEIDYRKYDDANTLSVEVVKALPLVSSPGKGQAVVKIEGTETIHIPGLDDKGLSASLGHVQQISLGRNGELVDHYVVHLTESVDGSGPTIQTAFIPAVSGGQLFTRGPGGLDIQPIAIIAARSFNMTQTDGSGTQVLTSDGANAIIACTQGQLEGTDVSGGSFITVSDGTHLVSDGDRGVKSELGDAGMIMLSEDGMTSTSDSRGCQIVEIDSVGVEGHEASSHMMDLGGKEQSMVVIDNHGMMMSASDMASVETGGDMMDTALSLFSPQSNGESYVGGQVVVSGDQAYIACNVDYSTTDHGLDSNNCQ